MNFFRRNKPAVAPKEDLKQVTAAPKQTPAANSRQNRNGQAAYNVLSKKDDIPAHSAVLSVTNGPIELSAEWQKKYAILLTNRDKKEVEVICSLEVVRQAGLDEDYLAIVDRIKRSGYVRAKTKILAKPEIIQIIYEQTEQKRSVEEQQKAATQIQLEFDELLVSAVKARASDIHIEVTRRGAEVKFRVDGALTHFTEWPVRHARTMAGVIYMVIAEEKDTSFDERRDQSAIIDRELGEHGQVRVRLNTLPTYPAGFDMIMRILKMGQSGEKIDLNKLGYNREQLARVRRGSAKPVGVMMMAGTTGSGKSTSLNAMLSEKIAHHGGRIKVITVEDPPEYLLIGATQVPVVRSRSAAKEGADVNPFASTIRAAMRSDPDVLMIGEVRDHHSAELLIHAVQSGHPVFTTTHASSGIDIVSRLRSNGVPDDVLGSHNFISALMYQTLLKTVCQHCSTDFEHFKTTVHDEAGDELVHRVYRYLGSDQAKQLRFINDDGCPHCRKGVTGRTVAAEVIIPDAYMLRAFRDRQDSDALMHYAYNGGRFALHHGLTKMLAGQCDIQDVEHKLDQIAALQEMSTSTRFFAASPQYSAFIKAQIEAQEALIASGNQASSIILLDHLQESVAPAKKPAATPKETQPPELPDEPVVAVTAIAPAIDAEDLTTSAAPIVIESVVKPTPALQIQDVPTQLEPSLEQTAAVAEAEPSPVEQELAVPQAPTPEQPLADSVTAVVRAEDDFEAKTSQAPAADQPVPVEAISSVIVEQESEVAQIKVVQDEIRADESKKPALDNSASLSVVEAAVEAAQPVASAVVTEPVPEKASLIQALLPVLKSEVQRTGINLTGRFFKARLSTAAITALIASENTPVALSKALEATFLAQDGADLDAAYSTTADQLQAVIDSDQKQALLLNAGHVEIETPAIIEPVPEPAAKGVPAQEVKKTPSPRASTKKVTPLPQKRATAVKDKAVEAKPKAAPRAYKSKLLSTGEPQEAPVVSEKESKPKGAGNVKSLADARAKSTKATAKAKKDSSTSDDSK